MKLSLVNQSDWRSILRNNFTKWEDLASFLELDSSYFSEITNFKSFPLNLPLRLAEKIQKNNFKDPILLQFLPTTRELLDSEGFLIDPVGDQLSRKCSKLLHKYHGRALLVCTSACAMHCRYCFRRNFPYENQDKSFNDEIHLIENDRTLKEIILSGGDPLSLNNEILERLLNNLDKISHIKTIRFHTRFPIGIPERIDETFLSILNSLSKQVVFVIHSNHPNEIDDVVVLHLKKLQKLGIPILNQSVLLKGVNDNKETLKSLCQKLSENGIIPYYLHQLDRAKGTSHFETTENLGKSLIEELTKELPGYSVPKYVKEISGECSKTRIV